MIMDTNYNIIQTSEQVQSQMVMVAIADPIVYHMLEPTPNKPHLELNQVTRLAHHRNTVIP